MTDKESDSSSTVDREVAEVEKSLLAENGSSVDKEIYYSEKEDKGETESVEYQLQSTGKKEELVDITAADGDRRDDPAELKSEGNASKGRLVNSSSDGDVNEDSPTADDDVKEEPMDTTSDDMKNEPLDQCEPVSTMSDGVVKSEHMNETSEGESHANITSDKSVGLKTVLEVASESGGVDTVAHADKESEVVNVASDDAKKSEKNEPVKTTSDHAEQGEESEPVNTVPDKLEKKTESGSIASDDIKESDISEKDEPVNMVFDDADKSEKNEPGKMASDDAAQSEKSQPVNKAPGELQKTASDGIASDDVKKSIASGKDEPVEVVSESSSEASKEKRALDRYQLLDENFVRDEIDFCAHDWDREKLKQGYVPTPRPKLLATPAPFTEVPPGATFFKEVSRRAILEIEYEDPFESIKLFSLIGVEKRPITFEDVPAEYRPYKGCIFVSECYCMCVHVPVHVQYQEYIILYT